MPRANISQPNFLGGEWSPEAQGRFDDPRYKIALGLSCNGQPVEEGSWLRRSGTKYIAPTYNRLPAKLLPFLDGPTCSFAMEFTRAPSLRFVTNDFLICDNTASPVITASSSANPFTVTIASLPAGWAVGDQLWIVVPSNYSSALDQTLRNRVLTIEHISSATLTLYDDTNTNAVNGSAFAANSYVGCSLLKIVRLTPPTYPDITKLRTVQAEELAIILDGTGATEPYTVDVETLGTTSTDPVFSFAATTFVDGPYLDPQPDIATLSGTSGSITVTPTGPSYSFVSTDVGRHIRLMTQPALWNSGTTYTYGEFVTDGNGAYWMSIASGAYASSNVDIVPGTLFYTPGGLGIVMWAPAPQAVSWGWGIVTSVTTGIATITLEEPLLSSNGTTATIWQLGLYTNTGSVWPTCGVYHEGRLWFGGAVSNRFDACTSNFVNVFTGNSEPDGTFPFSPTDQYGNVNDDCGIAEVLNASDLNKIQWMASDVKGIIMGTLSGEYLVSASELSDPITPNDIQAKRISSYGSGAVPAVRAGMAIVFAQKYGQRVIEYLADAFTGLYTGRHVNEYAKHLSITGIKELYYQEEFSPTIWALMNDGSLAGCTYRRFNRFVSAPPDTNGWFSTNLGTLAYPRAIESMCVVPRNDGLIDRLFMATTDSAGFGMLEIMMPLPPAEFVFGSTIMVDTYAGAIPGRSPTDCGGGNPGPVGTGIAGFANIDSTDPTDPNLQFPYDPQVDTGTNGNPYSSVNQSGGGGGSNAKGVIWDLDTQMTFPAFGSDSYTGTLSFWFRTTNTQTGITLFSANTEPTLDHGGFIGIGVTQLHPSVVVGLSVTTSEQTGTDSGSPIISSASFSTANSAGTSTIFPTDQKWHHIFMQWDFSTGTPSSGLWLDGVLTNWNSTTAQTFDPNPPPGGTTTAYTEAPFPWSSASTNGIDVFDTASAGEGTGDISLAEVWLAVGTTVPTVSQFLNTAAGTPKDLGPNGNIPLAGTLPSYFFHHTTTDSGPQNFTTNLGSAGSGTLNGSNPTDQGILPVVGT